MTTLFFLFLEDIYSILECIWSYFYFYGADPKSKPKAKAGKGSSPAKASGKAGKGIPTIKQQQILRGCE